MPQQHYHKWTRKAISKTNKLMIPLFFLQTSWALWIRYCVWASLLCFPLASATVISYSDHKRGNKAAITVLHDEACLWRIDQNCVSIWKTAGNKDSPVVFVYTVHPPIKMQMNARLQSWLSKQQRKEKKEQSQKGINKKNELYVKPEQTEITLIPKSSGRYSAGREQCVCECV